MLNKQWSKQVPTAGVGLIGINYNLYLNEDFWASLNHETRQGLLKHELLHIGFFHLTDFPNLTDKRLANIAQDLEINQYIEDKFLPPGGMTLDLFPELNLEPKKGCIYYYEELMKAKQNGNSPNLNSILEAIGQDLSIANVEVDGNNQDVNLPDHSTWGEMESMDEATQKLIRKQTEHILKEVADQVTKSRGTVPGEFSEIFERINHVEPPKFDWKSFLRRFTGGSTQMFTKKTRRKLSKRYEENPGLKIKPKRHILVGIDTSGSVSKSELEEFLHEMYHIQKNGTEVTIVEADTYIRHVSKYNPKKDVEIHGRGGTDFQPVIDYYNDNTSKYTCLVYFTDGEAPAPIPARGRMLWVLSSRSSKNEELIGPQIVLN